MGKTIAIRFVLLEFRVIGKQVRFIIDAGIRKTFLDKKFTLSLQANDLWNSRYSSFMLFGPRLTYTKKANPDYRSFSLNISYRFNTAGKTYKGGHASKEDLRRL